MPEASHSDGNSYSFETRWKMAETREANKKTAKKSRTKQAAKKNHKKNVKKLSKERRFPCDQCQKSFSKKSNLTSHQKGQHMGLVWICTYCQKTQTSKFSHKRHIEKCEHYDKSDKTNPDANAAYLTSKIQLTPKAAALTIETLTKNNLERANIIIKLKKRLLSALKQNVALKNMLKIEVSDEDKEIEELQWVETVDVPEETSQ